MGVVGEPSTRARSCSRRSPTCRRPRARSCRGGTRGGDVFDAAAEAVGSAPDGELMTFLAHGTGLLSHEAPRLTETGSPPYPATHRELPLQPGMVLSVETHAIDDEVGFVKLEDTVIVTADGCEPCGDHGRGWNAVGG